MQQVLRSEEKEMLLTTMGTFNQLRQRYQITAAKDFFRSDRQRGRKLSRYTKNDYYFETAAAWSLFQMIGIGSIVVDFPVEVMGDTVRFREELLDINDTVAFMYNGKKYFVHKPEKGVLEIYETIEESD
jgi:hypothetical protein